MALDPKLESKMLAEEIGEVLAATSPAHRLQEVCDFLFVWAGTWSKFVSLADVPPELRRWAYDLSETASKAFEIFVDMLKADGTEDLIGPALTLVCDANDWKPTHTVNGKIVKGPFYVSPLEAIEELVADAINN